jgi:glycoprotein-N-acetylgalactosamine 3-beta-galactosyltransferase
MNLREWPLATQSACESVLSPVEIAVINNINISIEYIHQPFHLRLLCLTYTISQNHDAVRNILGTWGSKCDGYLAFSNLSDPSISTIRLSPNNEWEEKYDKIWEKLVAIWTVIGETIIDDYDWFIVGGDDLYVIVDNLRSLLQSRRVVNLSRNGSKPIYLGRNLRKNSYLKFASGG